MRRTANVGAAPTTRPAADRGRGVGLIRGVPRRLGGQPGAACDRQGIRRRPCPAAVGRRRLSAHARGADPGCRGDLRSVRPAVRTADGCRGIRGGVGAVRAGAQRLGTDRRPMRAGHRRGVSGAQLAGDDQLALLGSRAGPRHRHVDSVDRHRLRGRSSARRPVGRRGGLAVDLRDQHRAAGGHACT